MAIHAWTTSVFAHISLDIKAAPVASSYKAVSQVGHGCQGQATTGVTVRIPAGFKEAKPMPKAGWTLATTHAALAAVVEQVRQALRRRAGDASIDASDGEGWQPGC